MQVGGGRKRENVYNHRYNNTTNYIGHYRYNIYDDKTKIHLSRTLTLTKYDIARLQPGRCLNDTIIEFGIRKYVHHNNKSILVLSPLFYTVLINKGSKKVRTWHKSDIFKRHLIFIPIHSSHHWSLCVIYM